MNRHKKSQKCRVPLQFCNRNPFKNESYQTITTVKLDTIFEKSRRSSVILKINGVTPQLTKIYKPQEICVDIFSIYISMYLCSV